MDTEKNFFAVTYATLVSRDRQLYHTCTYDAGSANVFTAIFPSSLVRLNQLQLYEKKNKSTILRIYFPCIANLHNVVFGLECQEK